MTDKTPEQIAEIYLGKNHRGTYAPDRINSLLRFPGDGSSCRCSVFTRYGVWRRLRDDGLVDGIIGDANLTPLGLAVRAILKGPTDEA